MSWGMEGSDGTAATGAAASARATGAGKALGGNMIVVARVLTTEPNAAGTWW